MRGILIKMGARAKKQRWQRIQDINSKLFILEDHNKTNTCPRVSDQLTQLRYDLRLKLLENFEKVSKRLKCLIMQTATRLENS